MIVERLLKVALLGSSWVLYLLLALSVVSFSTMFERYLYFRKHRTDFDALRRQLRKHLQEEDLADAEKLLEQSPAIEARVALEGLRWASGGPGAMSDAVDSELSRVKTELERGLNLLGTLGNNAPFVGLFGTVIGVIGAFEELGRGGSAHSVAAGPAGQVASQAVMTSIAEALVATAVGIFVALPAVAAFNYFQRRIASLLLATDVLANLVLAYISDARSAEPTGGGE